VRPLFDRRELFGMSLEPAPDDDDEPATSLVPLLAEATTHMSRFIARSVLLITIIVGLMNIAWAQGRGGAPAPAMTLTTTAWADGTPIPPKYTQAGDQVSPALKWTNVPAGTQTFVIHMHDPDAALNRGTEDQVHWLVWNIPANTTEMPEGVPVGPTLKDGAQQISATGPQYRGPGAPANGPPHHYTIEVYALDTKLDVQPSANTQPANAAVETRTNVFKAMQGHILGKAVYVGLFRRPQ
jgi:Raf kinase inhibitor-like YbhB/YbcL family protein